MMKRVVLVCMPFGPLNYPSLALSLLKALVQREGIVCDLKSRHCDMLSIPLQGKDGSIHVVFDCL
jgi:hypothetical protein